jgi:hypothetical protein
MPSPCHRALSALLPVVALLLSCPPVFAARASLDRPATPFSRLDATSTHVLAITGVPAAQKVDAGTTLLAVDPDAVRAFRDAGGGALAIPAADGGTVELELEPYALFADGSGPTYTDDNGRHPFTADVSLYRGHVAGDTTSWAVVSMSGSGVLGVIEQHGERLTLGPVQKMAGPAAAAMGVHALAPEGSLAEEISHFECGINANNEVAYGLKPLPVEPSDHMVVGPEATNLNGARFQFNLAVDNDYEMYGVKFGGNLTAVTAYMMTVLGTVNLIDERDLETTLKLVYLNFWTTTSDPYTAADTGNELTEFRAYWLANNGAISSHMQHLVSGRALGGGIAFLDAVCSNGYGVSAIDAIYTYPTATTTWDVEVITHELGHNLGSPHTHSCAWVNEGRWPAGTLDSCATPEGSCATYTKHVPPDKGTIMSYCHLISSVAAGIRLDFHPVCVSRMRGVMSNCALFPTPSPPRNPIATTTATGLQLTWTASPTSGVTGYSVYRSRLPLDLGAVRVGQIASSPYNASGIGTYYFRMRALRAADSSSFSGEVKAAACPFNSAGPVTVGSFPTAATTEDLNADGIQDVVLVTTGSGNLVTLLGQGAAGIGNGNFAVPVSVASGPSPVCLGLLDVNGDGILDAVVGAQDDNSLYLHLGQGAAGVGNGTFAPGVPIATVAFSPTGIAVADFNEDGILDLAVAGGGASIAVLFGQGAAGVPNGTFAAPVSIATAAVTRGILAYDFNADGITDLAVSGASVKLLYGNGTSGKGDGTFTLGPSYLTSTTPNHLATADFNGDGLADLVVCNTGASSVNVYLGNGTGGVPDGTFAAGISVPTGTGPNSVAVADWDQDGRADIAVASNNTANSTSILLGLGNGTFEVPQTFATGANNPAAIAVNDFNEDGAPDLLACNRSSQSVTRQLAGCPNVLSHALAMVSPNGAEVWAGDTEHTISWTKGAGVMTVDLQRSDDSGVHWRTLARGLTGTSYAYTVTAPWTTHARFRVVESHAAEFSDGSNADFEVQEPVQVGVGNPPATLALLGAQPNPARQDLTVSYSLAQSGARGTLELLDLAGRRVAWRDLSGEAAGRHQVRLLERQALQPGVYMLRLSHAGQVRGMKVAVSQ